MGRSEILADQWQPGSGGRSAESASATQTLVHPIRAANVPRIGGRSPLAAHPLQSLMASDIWTDEMVAMAGVPIRDSEFVSIGGGIGSFVMTDYLRICGMEPQRIKVLTQLTHPWETYEYLARASQLTDEDRIRSDSASRPDCIWGFPSFALSEAVRAKSLRGFLSPIFQILTEPVFTDYYTPKLGQVLKMLQREAARISYAQLVEPGFVPVVRRRSGGGYFALLSPGDGASRGGQTAIRSRFVHLAVGYPGLRFLPDLQDYRSRFGDLVHVVNAYEPHDHVYKALRQRRGTVLIRGAGIVASRILERLIEDRDRLGTETTIVHLFRTYVRGSHGPSPFMRRRGGQGWAYQGFNYPKSAWGGQLRARMRELDAKEREELYQLIGGTTTASRKMWRRQLERGRREGWYRSHAGEVESITPGDRSQVTVTIRSDVGTVELVADYVIDATGMEPEITEHGLLADLLEHSNAGRNPLGRLDVEETFEVRGTRSGNGRMYAVGAATFGGPFPGVDTFLGLQLASQEIVDDMVGQGALRSLGPLRSTRAWLRWARNKRI